MRRTRPLNAALVASSAFLALAGCAQILGDFTNGGSDGGADATALPLEDARSGEDAGPDATSIAPDDATANTPDGTVDAPTNEDAKQSEDGGGNPEASAGKDGSPDTSTPCTVETSSDSVGIFVATNGAATSCGTRATPCNSIGAGLTALGSAGKSVLYVLGGTYVEEVNVASNVAIKGGWTAGASAWTRGCASNPTIVRAPTTTNTTVLVGGAAPTIDGVTIESKTVAAAGETLYGVFVTGASTTLSLVNVAITVAAGGDGTGGVAGGTGTAPPTICSTAGTGAAGTAATQGTPAPAGTFSASGYTASNGGNGGPGNAGQAGTLTAPDSHSCINSGHVCTVINTGIPVCSYVSSTVQSGGAGSPGCGGNGGGFGTGGGGGGSSIGVFATAATVTLTGGSVLTAKGGTGGNGGAAGPPSQGTAGSTGATYFNCGECGFNASNVCTQTTVNLNGGVGGAGGNGSAGGVGGGGAGGSSYGVYAQGGATITASATTSLKAGTAGTGGSGNGTGAAGTSAPKGP